MSAGFGNDARTPAPHADASAPRAGYGEERSFRRRLASFLLALAAEALLVLMLLRLAPAIQGTPHGQGTLSTFSLAPSDQPSSGARQPRQPKKAEQAKAAPRTAPKPPPTPTVPPPVVPQRTAEIIHLTPQDYAASDISKLPSHAAEKAAGTAGNGTETAEAGGGPGDTPRMGSGPNGEPLYAAEWVREPTNAELDPYLPPNRSGGDWGEIACRTVARFHVEDCVELGDALAGTGIARGAREAAFQFLVRPPRVGGKLQVGAWVRIRIWIRRAERP